MFDWIAAAVVMFGLSFVQNVSFSIVSRSRNRDNNTYHLIAAFFSNGIWFLTMRYLVRADLTMALFLPYCLGTVTGSLAGVRVSMWIERMLGAGADTHLKKTPAVTEERVAKMIDTYGNHLVERVAEMIGAHQLSENDCGDVDMSVGDD